MNKMRKKPRGAAKANIDRNDASDASYYLANRSRLAALVLNVFPAVEAAWVEGL